MKQPSKFESKQPTETNTVRWVGGESIWWAESFFDGLDGLGILMRGIENLMGFA